MSRFRWVTVHEQARNPLTLCQETDREVNLLTVQSMSGVLLTDTSGKFAPWMGLQYPQDRQFACAA